MKVGNRLNSELAATIGLWGYVGCHRPENMSTDLGHITDDCGACGNRNLRFVHTLYQPDDLELGQLEVCVECARILIGDVEWDIPGDAENKVKREECGAWEEIGTIPAVDHLYYKVRHTLCQTVVYVQACHIAICPKCQPQEWRRERIEDINGR